MKLFLNYKTLKIFFWCPIKNNDLKTFSRFLKTIFKECVIRRHEKSHDNDTECAYSKRSYYYFRKKVNILYIISTEVEQNMCQKFFFNVICYIAKAAAATTSHTQFFSSTSSSYSSVLLLCYL